MRKQLSVLLTVLTVVLCYSCGGGSGSPAAPSSTPSPTPSPTPAPTPVPAVTYNFEPGVSEADRSTIEAAVTRARTYFDAKFGRTVQRPITVTVRAADGPSTASASSNAITVYTLHEGWRIIGPAQRTKIMVHELFHILQMEVAFPNLSGGWMHEGSAEYVGYASIIEAGMATYDEVRQCQISNYFGADGPSAPRLEEISFEASSPVRGRYLIAWLAWDRLLSGPAGVPKLRDYWQSGFQAAFGVTEPTFYDQFVQYRRGLSSPSSNVCASLNSR